MTDEIVNNSTISITFETYADAMGYEFYVEVEKPQSFTRRLVRRVRKNKYKDIEIPKDRIILFYVDTTTGNLDDLGKVKQTVICYNFSEPD